MRPIKSLLAILAGLVPLALGVLSACSNSPTDAARCGNTICTGDEDESNCPRDCPSLCVPNTQRCVGNVSVICRADGEVGSDDLRLFEVADSCQAGEFCTNTALVSDGDLEPRDFCEGAPNRDASFDGRPADIGVGLDASDVTTDPDATTGPDALGDSDVEAGAGE